MKLNRGNSSLRICVDSVAHGQASGRVYGQRLEEPLLFSDIGDLLIKIDDLLNVQDYPRAFQRKRSFGVEQRATAPPPKELEGDFMSIETVKAAQGETATFGINVTMRQNTSWQGSIDWLDGSDPTDFISALEFIRIVHDAVIT